MVYGAFGRRLLLDRPVSVGESGDRTTLENFLAGIGLQFADPRTGSCTGGLDCRTAAPTAGETVQILIDQPSVVDGVGRDCNRVDRTRIFSV